MLVEYRIDLNSGKLDVYKSCDICEKFYKIHSNLRTESRLALKQKVNGSWYHTSTIGRKIHKLAIKDKTE